MLRHFRAAILKGKCVIDATSGLPCQLREVGNDMKAWPSVPCGAAASTSRATTVRPRLRSGSGSGMTDVGV